MVRASTEDEGTKTIPGIAAAIEMIKETGKCADVLAQKRVKGGKLQDLCAGSLCLGV